MPDLHKTVFTMGSLSGNRNPFVSHRKGPGKYQDVSCLLWGLSHTNEMATCPGVVCLSYTGKNQFLWKKELEATLEASDEVTCALGAVN